MKPLPQNPELLTVATRVVWFKEPAEALADPVHFLAPVMTFGTVVGGNLDDIVCEQHECRVGKDNCVRYDGRVLQVPADRFRCNSVKPKVRVDRCTDACWAVFHGPRRLARYKIPKGHV